VRGFAATLLIGVVMSLFTGIVATRTFIRVLYKEKGIV
jgi:preprotein translocase subunit SecD